jgi:GNAT superfamily N-acetyltransferase
VLYVERNGSTGKIARQLLGAAEEWLARKGINRTGWWCEPGSRLHKLLKSAGYAEDEVLMEKVLPCVP